MKRIFYAVATLAVLVLVVPNLWVWGASAGRIVNYGDADDTAQAPVAIVLGASVYANGQPSPWVQYRLDVAANLYNEGRVDAILVSGDNGQTEYDEPTVMRDYLVSVGIPTEAVALDYAGFDTYDTCVRANEVFGVSQAILVTQDFHEPRAVSVCNAVGVDAVGVGDAQAHEKNPSSWLQSWGRERLAVVKAAWDVLVQRTPTLGDYETSVDEAVSWTQSRRG